MLRPLAWLSAAAATSALLLAPTQAADFFLPGINYNIRKGPDYAAPAEKCKDAAQIAHELTLLKDVTDVVRLYSLVDCDQATAAVPAIIAAGLQLELGLWVGPNNSVYADERELFKTLVQNKTLINSETIVGIHVGSEAIYRKDVDAATAISNLKEIKQIATAADLHVPVSIGDIGDTYLAYEELFEAVDFVSANLFPFWEKVEAATAADHFLTRYEKVATAAAKYNKTVVVGETGWATNGKHIDASEASSANAATFFHDFYLLAKTHNITYYYFAAFDEQWKLQFEKEDATVEGYFGLFTADGKLKDEYASLKLDSAEGGQKETRDADEEEGEGEAEGEGEVEEGVEEEGEQEEGEVENESEEEDSPPVVQPAPAKPCNAARVKITVRRGKVSVEH